MKRGCPDHPKLHQLARMLVIGRPQAGGHLEFGWHWTAKYAPDGAIGRFGASAFAEACGWTGDPDVFITAMTAAGWLDVDEHHGLLVHDWPEHCDDAVHRQLARAGRWFATGAAPKITGLSGEEKLKAAAIFGTGVTTGPRRAHVVATPGKTRPPAVAVPGHAMPGPAVPTAGGDGADDDQGDGPSTPKCIRAGCTGELRRETGRWRETSTGGVGWFCPRTERGCGTVYQRGEPAILAQLSPRARAALEQEIQREEVGRAAAAAEAAMTPEARAMQELVGELRRQQQPAPGEPPGRNGAFASATWLKVVEHLRPNVTVQSFATWLRAPAGIGILTDGEGERLVVQVPTTQAREWLSVNYRAQINQAFRDVGRFDLGLVYVTEEEAAAVPPLDTAAEADFRPLRIVAGGR